MSKIVDKINSELKEAYKSRIAAANQAESLRIISSDIYTEAERFIFELIQNAVDSYVDTSEETLDIRMELKDGYLVFMHNGKAFSDRDVEGICGIGNGSKGDDAKKIGYKGIGFKSVFVHSNDVVISSDEHCFRFSEREWDNFEHKMPWQIIPIECKEPLCMNDRSKYNVATYIYLKRPDEIQYVVANLLSNSQFLLFLRCADAVIRYVNNESVLTLSKETRGNIIELFSNGVSDSVWLTHTTPLERSVIPEETKRIISNDEKTPNKLKESNYFDLSFAIRIEDGKIAKTEGEEAVLYTYLPTSMQSGFPFLVNANFITDAGRQQIHKDCEWNKFIYSVIPGELLNWISEISKDYPNYYRALPTYKTGGSSLDNIFNESLKSAIENIAFIPSLRGSELLFVSEAVLDKTGINCIFNGNSFIEYLNRQFSKKFTANSYIDSQGLSILTDYGVFIFDNIKLKDLFNDSQLLADVDVEFSLKLISYLENHVSGIKSVDQKNDFIESLSRSKVILSNKGTMECPSSLFLPSECKVGMTDDVPLINTTLFNKLSAVQKSFICKLGVQEQTYSNYIFNVLCKEDYITSDNAVAVGRFIFNAFIKGNINNDDLHKLGGIKFLNKKGNLCAVNTLFLSNEYNPSISLDSTDGNDQHLISETYIYEGDNPNDWNFFLKGIGAKDEIRMSPYRYSTGEMTDVFGSTMTKIREKINYNPNPYIHTWGVEFEYYPIILTSKDHNILKKIFSNILSTEYPSKDNSCSLEYRWSVDEHMQLKGDFWKISFLDKFSLREFTLRELQYFPSNDGNLRLASELFVNSPINVKIVGEYLPMIDVDCEIHSSWARILDLKRDLTLSDYLQILEAASRDSDTDNRERISLVYKNMVNNCYLQNENNINELQNWCKNNKLLSTDGQFYRPDELAYMRVQGFEGSKDIYIGDLTDNEVTVLLNAFGINIFNEDSIYFEVIGEQFADTYLHSRIIERLPYIALMKIASDATYVNFTESYNELEPLAEKFEFVNCAGISLSHSNFKKTVQTFSRDGKFYYVGNLNIAKLEAIIQSLAHELGIRNRQKELFVILLDNLEDVKNYCKDRGYDLTPVEELSVGITESVSADTLGVGIDSGIDIMKRYEYSEEAKKLVQKRLESEGFEFTKGLGSYSVINGVMRNGMEYPLVVKSCLSWDNTTTINPAEWEALFKRNSMLWIHFGHGHIEPINAHEIFSYNDQFTLSFSTINLQEQKKVNAILSVLRYLNGVKLDLRCIAPSEPRGRNLDEYLFNVNRTIDDLNAVDKSLL